MEATFKKKVTLKRIFTGMFALVLAFITILSGTLVDVEATSKSTYPQPYPWSKVAGGTTGDYIADSYEGITSGHVIESVTQERLLDILSSSGNYYIIFGGPEHATSQAVLSTINAEAKKNGITKIYHFDPFVDGYQIDITKSDSVFKTSNGTSVNQLWTRITALLPQGALDNYDSKDTLLFLYNKEDNSPIKASYILKEGSNFDAQTDTAKITQVFKGGSDTGTTIQSSIRSDFEFFKREYNGFATYFNYNSGKGPDDEGNRTGEASTEIFTEADRQGFTLHQVNFVELLNLLNSPGEHIIFFGASWCHNTQAIIGDVSRKATQNGHKTVYVYDTTLGNQLTFGTGENINKVTASSSAFNTRNSVDLNTKNGNIGYVYGELAKYLGDFITENHSNKGTSISYYPNGDLSGTATSTPSWETGTNQNAIRLQLPFLIGYNKDKAKPVTKQWLHKNSANNGTYREYMLELAWVLEKGNAAKAGSVDGISKIDFAKEAVAALDNVLKKDKDGVSLSQSGTYTFTPATIGYSNIQAQSITVNNQGPNPSGELSVELSGANSTSFTLSKTSINSIVAGGSDSFTIAPINGLATGTYTATVTVKNGGVSESFNVSFTVNPVAKDAIQYPVITNFTTFTGVGDAVAKIDADVNKFVSLSYQGKEVDVQNYTVSSGSTIITLKESYLKTFENGSHNFVAKFTDGTAALTLNVNVQPGSNTKKPTTGDTDNLNLWGVFAATSLLAIGILVTKRRRFDKITNR